MLWTMSMFPKELIASQIDHEINAKFMPSSIDLSRNLVGVSSQLQQGRPSPAPGITVNPTRMQPVETSWQAYVKDLASSHSPSGSPFISSSLTPSGLVESPTPTLPDKISDSAGPSSSPSSWSPNSFTGHAPLPKVAMLVEGSIGNTSVFRVTLQHFLTENLRQIHGLEMVQDVNLAVTVIWNHDINANTTRVVFNGTVWFGTQHTPTPSVIKFALVTIFKDLRAIQLALDFNAPQLGRLTVSEAFVEDDYSSLSPSAAPPFSIVPSFQPSLGEVETICSMQKTQVKCLEHDCEWRNYYRKCRDYLKRENIDTIKINVTTNVTGSGATQPLDEVPPINSIVWGFIFLAIAIGSIGVLAILLYLCKLSFVASKRKHLSPDQAQHGKFLMGEIDQEAVLPQSTNTEANSNKLLSRRESADGDSLNDAYTRSDC